MLQNLICHNFCCFVAKSVLSRFKRFCVEKNLTKNCACGGKKTNIRYGSASPCITTAYFFGSKLDLNWSWPFFKHSNRPFDFSSMIALLIVMKKCVCSNDHCVPQCSLSLSPRTIRVIIQAKLFLL